MSRSCFDCRKELHPVPQSLYLNSEQWDAVKAGDYFAKCERSTHLNGNCYFRDTDGVVSLKSKSLAPPSTGGRDG